MLNKNLHTDFLIIGSGLAGLYAAYYAAKFGKVLILTKSEPKNINSWLAQGGVAVAIGESDSVDLHFDDTITAGRELCDEDAVKILVKEGKDRIEKLIEFGMQFDKEGDNFSLGMEGGHTVRRILHANGSATGKAILEFLLRKINNIENISFLYNTQCLELVKKDNRIVGVYAHQYQDNTILSIQSKSTIIATGGYSRIFQRSTNSLSTIGEGISIAMKAGAIVKDMEFIQFHPTVFYSKTGKSFLISETVRGEGAFLLNQNLQRFMIGKHKLKELAPRDIISKAIYLEIQNSEIDHVYLDLRHLDSTHIKNRFPNIYEYAKEFSVDITEDLIPIAPAAHYSIGGIQTDMNGKTNLGGLFACGEATATGVHGANRLASNSLLECLVFSKRAVLKAANEISNSPLSNIPNKNFVLKESTLENYKTIKGRIQNIFLEYVGILRNEDQLKAANKKIKSLGDSIPEDHNDIAIIKTKGLINLASSIIKSALIRKESRGTHQRTDFPNQSENELGNYYILNSEVKFEEKNGN